ncbi:hypothetical protein JRO89_XS13G0008500 [Xanthoceras sorbifolium]|uniref:Protein CHAPERONE-LIKE PROTEIN OF POR1, chloroplastic n=1 Tax=Xanthoceras sorbifolium TaxID=99658 RepID=A0ABQ8H5S7_9ROSI|nr:hypothetical protein JRO89_XS13G0008500 [Xanthoceras sorbifolium]
MRSLLLSNPNLSTPFLHRHFSSCQNTKKAAAAAPPSPISRRPFIPRCSVDTPYGGHFFFLFFYLNNSVTKALVPPTALHQNLEARMHGNVPTFPRTNVWDPYKRLGVSPYASEEEIWGSRNFLLQQYAGHERSEESIEAAFEKLLMTSFKQRKKTKINLKSRLKKKVEESPPWIQNLLNFVELPPMDIIFRRLFLFAFMGGWSIMNSAEGGPAFQVAVSLAACIYFLNEKTKSLARASIIGFGALAGGWICGSFLVPMIPTVLIHPTWTLELLTSLVAYVFLFLACTFLK